MAEFPATVKNFLTLNDGVDKVIAAHPNDRAGETTAIETFLGALGVGNTQGFSAALVDLLQGYIQGAELTYVGVEEISVAAGRIAFESSGKFRWRENNAALSVDWGDIDTGAEASSTLYYVYAVADASGTGFTILISLSDTAPTGGTYYKKLGQFYNDSGDDIIESSVINDQPVEGLSAKIGDVVVTSVASVAVVDVGFKPKAVLFICGYNGTGEDRSGNAVGFWDGTSMFSMGAGFIAGDASGRGFISTNFVLATDSVTPTNKVVFTGTSFDDVGFTVNVTTATAGYLCKYLAIR